jgi:stage II sporulation protein P
MGVYNHNDGQISQGAGIIRIGSIELGRLSEAIFHTIPFIKHSQSESTQAVRQNGEKLESRGSGDTNRSSEGFEGFLKREPDEAELIPEDIFFEIMDIKPAPETMVLTEQSPQILIYHTHSREAFKQDPRNRYIAVEAYRSNDLEFTVVRIGGSLAKRLRERGISVLHDTTEHEQGDFSTAYIRSLKTIKSRMNDYPTLEIFLDIHRNAYLPGVRDPDDEVVIINGQRVARIFAVIGTGEGFVGGFEERPDWRENYRFALRITQELNKIHPELAKNIHIMRGRYNQHISTNAVLLEIGSNLTTLKEAERATYYLATALSRIIGRR